MAGINVGVREGINEDVDRAICDGMGGEEVIDFANKRKEAVRDAVQAADDAEKEYR